jgi:hypothetical protein
MARPLNPLPKKFSLPFMDYVVRIKLVPAGECKEEDGKILDGWWGGEDDPTIYIKKTLSMAEKRYTYGHELQHAVLDWLHRCLKDGIMKA